MFELTKDRRYIRECLTHPTIWEAGRDDGAPPMEMFFIDISLRNILYLKADGYGLFVLEKRNAVTFEVHVALINTGGKGRYVCRSAIEWVFDNVPGVECLVANIPEYNRITRNLAEKVGFKPVGILPTSFKKNGELHNMYMYQFNKECLRCHH